MDRGTLGSNISRIHRLDDRASFVFDLQSVSVGTGTQIVESVQMEAAPSLDWFHWFCSSWMTNHTAPLAVSQKTVYASTVGANQGSGRGNSNPANQQ